MTNLSVFNQDTANTLFNSTEQFPIKFDDAWQWLDYSRKDKGLDSFLNCGFSESIDFIVSHQKGENLNSAIGGRPSVKYSLTIDCFKSWAMMSKTETGKQVRLYFLECERIAKENSQTKLPPDFDFQLAMGIDKINNGTLPASVKQLLIDNLVNKYIDSTPKLTESSERWVGLVQKAEELGFKTNSSNRVKLGHYGTKEESRVTRKKEKRLCNGEMRAIWVYLDEKPLEIVIREYFAIEALGV